MAVMMMEQPPQRMYEALQFMKEVLCYEEPPAATAEYTHSYTEV